MGTEYDAAPHLGSANKYLSHYKHSTKVSDEDGDCIVLNVSCLRYVRDIYYGQALVNLPKYR